MKATRQNIAAGMTALALLAGAGFAHAADTRINLSTGLEYSSGTYGGTEDIEELYVPVTLRMNTNRIGLSVSVPFLSVHAPSGTVSDGQTVPGSGEFTTESGLGDVTANLTVYDAFYSAERAFALDVTGAVKFGTADFDKGLGTGENDYSLYFDGYKWFEGFTLLGSVGYRLRGEPEGIELDDVFLASLGGAWPAGNNATLGVVFDYRQSALAGYDDIQELTGYGSFELSEHWRMQVYGFAGFTDSSTDWGGGLTVTTDVKRPRSRDAF